MHLYRQYMKRFGKEKVFESIKLGIVSIHRGLQTRRLASLFRGKGVRQVVDLVLASGTHTCLISPPHSPRARTYMNVHIQMRAYSTAYAQKHAHTYAFAFICAHAQTHEYTVTLARGHTQSYYSLKKYDRDISLRSLRLHSRHLAGKLFHEFYDRYICYYSVMAIVRSGQNGCRLTAAAAALRPSQRPEIEGEALWSGEICRRNGVSCSACLCVCL